METVRLENVVKSYQTQSTDILIDGSARPSRSISVLRGLTVSFEPHRITAIIGRSGCGKSTLLRLLEGREQPDSGSVILPEGWRSTLLSPDPYVISWTSVLNNVVMAAGAGREPDERRALAERLIRLVQLDGCADMTPPELSTGMRQRLGLARTLASQAQLLLLDEPFASLDFITRGELQQVLLSVRQELDKTILLVTHQLEEALLLAQRIVVMHEDSAWRDFELSMPYPRELSSPELLALREEITQECRRDCSAGKR